MMLVIIVFLTAEIEGEVWLVKIIQELVRFIFKPSRDHRPGLGAIPFPGLARALQVGLSPLMPYIPSDPVNCGLAPAGIFCDLITAFTGWEQIDNFLPLCL